MKQFSKIKEFKNKTQDYLVPVYTVLSLCTTFFINMAALSLSGLYDWIDKFNAFLAAIGLLCEYWFQVCRYGN